ncbi:outer membrane protein [Planctomycetes bacterium K23_9]|uniref:Outer membrane protein PagN n=1 Tax=Stieleria marina TaxID=1930275 RepID=A0A517NWW5_9BACT|nr:Outer membrane protein PagN precursor [Planctomycetes bacterium K23_9]
MFRFIRATATIMAIAIAVTQFTSYTIAQDQSVLETPIYEPYPGDGYGVPSGQYDSYPSNDSQLNLIGPSLSQGPMHGHMQGQVVETMPEMLAPLPMTMDTGAGMNSYGIGCGVEEIGCGLSPAPACDCGPVCGCESAPMIATPLYSPACSTGGCDSGGLLGGGCLANAKQSMRNMIGETSPCDPCSNTIRPGLIPWFNDFCVNNGFALDSFLVSGCGYFSVDFGIAMTGDRANFIGSTADAIGGAPTYDLQEGSLGRYAIGMGNGNYRMELELGIHRNTIDETKSGSGPRSGDRLKVDGYRRSTTFMLNGFYDFQNSTFWTPYLKTGVGISHNVAKSSVLADINSPQSISALGLAGPGRFDSDYPRSSTTKFAWLVGAGFAIDLTDRIKFDCEYQFLNAGDASTGYSARGDALEFGNGALHELAFGFRFYR